MIQSQVFIHLFFYFYFPLEKETHGIFYFIYSFSEKRWGLFGVVAGLEGTDETLRVNTDGRGLKHKRRWEAWVIELQQRSCKHGETRERGMRGGSQKHWGAETNYSRSDRWRQIFKKRWSVENTGSRRVHWSWDEMKKKRLKHIKKRPCDATEFSTITFGRLFSSVTQQGMLNLVC